MNRLARWCVPDEAFAQTDDEKWQLFIDEMVALAWKASQLRTRVEAEVRHISRLTTAWR